MKPVHRLPSSLSEPDLATRRQTDVLWQDAEIQAALFRKYEELINAGYSLRLAAEQLDRSPSTFSGETSLYARWKREGLAGLLPKVRSNPAATTMPVPDWFVPAARFFYLLSNRTHATGSVPEAVRRTISLPNVPFGWTQQHTTRLLAAMKLAELPICPPALREQILARQSAGMPLVTPRLARQITVNAALVQNFRSPREASLNQLTAPGSQRRYTNEHGERVIMQAGDWFGGDDATPGIAICVPCKEVITPCSQNFGVLIGRFQWLAFHDGRTDKVLAWDYVVRPRGSYRAEDILNGMGAVTRAHGIPRRGWQFEGGAWNSKLVRQTIELMGTDHWRTYSPHQKAIESIFNRVWTKLAVQFPHADMGRYRNENEANCKLYEACKKGDQDPRKYFPTLATVLAVFEQEIAAHNAHRIFSNDYGQWVPDELFDLSVAAQPLRPLSAEMEWIFAPFATERKVRGMTVRCRIPMFEDFSVPFDFGADWLPLYNGKSVRIHFNPREPKCVAKVVLLERATSASGQVQEPGTVLGDAKLIGETGSYFRYLLDWGADSQSTGYLQRQRTAGFLRRETRAIGANGRVIYAASEERDGIDTVITAERRAVTLGESCTGSDIPATNQPPTSIRTDSSVLNGRSVTPQVSHTASDAPPVVTPDREARREEIRRLEAQTAHLFV